MAIAFVIKKGRSYLQHEDDYYGKLIGAQLYSSFKKANKDLEIGDSVAKVEIKDLGSVILGRPKR